MDLNCNTLTDIRQRWVGKNYQNYAKWSDLEINLKFPFNQINKSFGFSFFLRESPGIKLFLYANFSL